MTTSADRSRSRSRRQVSQRVEVAAREPRVFRALAGVPLSCTYPRAGTTGARLVDRLAGPLHVRPADAPFAAMLRKGFVVVASDPLREVRMARRMRFGLARRHALTAGAAVTVAPAGDGSELTASFELDAVGVVARLAAAAAWPAARRVAAVAMGRWLAAVGSEATGRRA